MPTYEGVWRPLDILTRLPRRLYSVNHVGRKGSHGARRGFSENTLLPSSIVLHLRQGFGGRVVLVVVLVLEWRG